MRSWGPRAPHPARPHHPGGLQQSSSVHPTETPGAMQRCSVLRGLTDGRHRALGGVCPLRSWSPTGVRGHHSLCHPRPLRADFWPHAGPSPPPRADFFQKQGHGRDSLEKPPPHPAVGLWWHLEEDQKTRSGSSWLLGLVLCFREAQSWGGGFQRSPKSRSDPGRTPEGAGLLQGPLPLGTPGTCPVTSSHPSVASPPSPLPPPLSRVPSVVGATSLLLRACSHWALPGTPRPHPRAPSHAVCSSYLLQAGPPPCLPARNSHHALLSLRVALDPLNLLCV